MLFWKKDIKLDDGLLKKVPILILDKNWHNIFPQEKKTKNTPFRRNTEQFT